MRNNKGQFKKGHIPWHKGKIGIFSKDYLKKLSDSRIGKKQTKEQIEKRINSRRKLGKWSSIPPSQKGVKRSLETIKKIKESRKGYKATIETRLKMRNSMIGKNSKGGLTPINAKIRGSIEFRLWRESVFARDNWTCQKTGIKGGDLHPHHILNFSQYPELRFAIDNGITLSKKAHKEFHKKYGYKNNTQEQINEFLT